MSDYADVAARRLLQETGSSRTLDWALALIALGKEQLDADIVAETLGCVFKYQDDIQRARTVELSELGL